MNPAVAKPLAVGAALGVCSVGLALWNPGDHGVPLCPTKALTGLDCPLCGGLRAVSTLTRGHVGLAAGHNVIVAIAVPIAVAWWLMWIFAAARGAPTPRPRWNRAATITCAVALVVFTIVRNLRFGGELNWMASETS